MEDNGGELAERVETRCGQRGSLLRERRETLCPLEADHDRTYLVAINFKGAQRLPLFPRKATPLPAPGPNTLCELSLIVPR